MPVRVRVRELGRGSGLGDADVRSADGRYVLLDSSLATVIGGAHLRVSRSMSSPSGAVGSPASQLATAGMASSNRLIQERRLPVDRKRRGHRPAQEMLPTELDAIARLPEAEDATTSDAHGSTLTTSSGVNARRLVALQHTLVPR